MRTYQTKYYGVEVEEAEGGYFLIIDGFDCGWTSSFPADIEIKEQVDDFKTMVCW